MPEPTTSELGQAIQEVSERASLLVREEIELAKAEMTEKGTKLLKGAGVGAAAGRFAVAEVLSLTSPDDPTLVGIGDLATGLILIVLGAIAGFTAARFMKSGSPPKPAMAI